MPSEPVEGVIFGRLFTILPPTRASQFSKHTVIDDRPEPMLSPLNHHAYFSLNRCWQIRTQKTQFFRDIPIFLYCKAKMNHLYNCCCLFGKLTKNIINYDGCCTKNRKQVLLIQVGQGYSSVLREVAERNTKAYPFK